MNEALQRWLTEFADEPNVALDRLVRGVVPLGAASQLSIAEILDTLFAPDDAVLDEAAATWLKEQIFRPIPEGSSLEHWASALQEFFRAIAIMELRATRVVLRESYPRIRRWLTGFYEGPDRDPEGAYLIALARSQADQAFSKLWRSLILGQDVAERPYLGVGILGFRKMPRVDGTPSPDVPDGLLEALIELADRPGTEARTWTQAVRSIFAAYPRTEAYWKAKIRGFLRDMDNSNAARLLAELIPTFQTPLPRHGQSSRASLRTQPVPFSVSLAWVESVRRDPASLDGPAFEEFISKHRKYASVTGDTEFITKSLNNLAITIIRESRSHSATAIKLIEEALRWEPYNAHNWTSYSVVLDRAGRRQDAIDVLWEARHRFPWYVYVRSELGRLVRESGDLETSAGVLREACTHFPDNIVCRTALADLLIDLGETREAERLYLEAMELDHQNAYARGGLAQALAIRSAKELDGDVRKEAKDILQQLSDEGNRDASARLRNFDRQWERAVADPSFNFRRETAPTPSPQARDRAVANMPVPERLGRALIALWGAERAEDTTQRATLCASAMELLDLPEEEVAADLMPVVVEARGLVLLAGGDPEGALAYFRDQIGRYGRGGWLGVRIGERRARLVLGGDLDDDDGFGSQSEMFALGVARVIQKLSSSGEQSEVSALLKLLYPLAATFAANFEAAEALAEVRAAWMLGGFLLSRWFRPAGVGSVEDLNDVGVILAVSELVKQSRTDTLDVVSNAAMAPVA